MPPRLDEHSETRRINVVAPATLHKRIEVWRRRQAGRLTKSDAVRALLESALEADGITLESIARRR